MVDAPGAQAALGNLEATAFAQQDVLDRHAHVVEQHLGVAKGRVVVVNQRHVAHDRDAGRVGRHDDHGLLAVPVGVVRVGLAHQDEDFAALVHRARDVPLAAVDDVFITLALNACGDVGCVG